MPPYLLLLNGWQNRFLFSLHSFLLQKSLHSEGTSIAITRFGTQELLPTTEGRKYSTGSYFLTSSPSMTLTHPSFSIAPLAVTPLLTSPFPPLLLPFPALGRCYRILVVTTYQFFYLSLSLRSIERPPSPFLQFSESSLGWLCLLL